jgi:hypothetical protein
MRVRVPDLFVEQFVSHNGEYMCTSWHPKVFEMRYSKYYRPAVIWKVFYKAQYLLDDTVVVGDVTHTFRGVDWYIENLRKQDK